MKEVRKYLDEVVVVGYGQMKRSDLTGQLYPYQSVAISKFLYQHLLIKCYKAGQQVCKYNKIAVCRGAALLFAFVV
jgi:hypothetical protein